MPREQPLLDPAQREKISVPELARHILCHLKLFVEKARDHGSGYHFSGGVETFSLPSLQEQICPENKVGCEVKDSTFSQKCYEAIALLKRRGLLMDVITSNNRAPSLHLTSVGERSDFDDGSLILIDDAQEIVNKVKGEVPNLDDVVEQYFLESLRTCQEGCYIASVICLGAASERAINCLAKAVIKHDDNRRQDIENQRSISALTNYLLDNVKQIFKTIADIAFPLELRDKLGGMAAIYRRNRNDAGHPNSVSHVWRRDNQECFLNEFRRYVCTVFKAIAILENGKQNEAEQS